MLNFFFRFIRSLMKYNLFKGLNPETDQQNVQKFNTIFQLQVLIYTMYLTKRPFIRPTNFVKFCTPEWFRWGQQQDSSEFLMFLFDNLNEQMKVKLSLEEASSLRLSADGGDVEKKNDTSCNQPTTTTTITKSQTLIQSSFGINLATECQCLNCKTVTVRTDECFYLPLSFSSDDANNVSNKKSTKSVQDLLNNFFQEEKLSAENDNLYSCSTCQSLQSALKRVSMLRNTRRQIDVPDYLVLTLNRFIYQKTNATTTATATTTTTNNLKIMDQLEYPNIVEVNVRDNESDNKDETSVEKYELNSLIIHSGSSLHYGHYYSYVTNKLTSETTGDEKIEWLLANDSQISETTFNSIVANQNLFKDDTPYVLIYRRQNLRDHVEESEIVANVNSKYFVDLVEQDNNMFSIEERTSKLRKARRSSNDATGSSFDKHFYSSRDNEDDDSKGGGGGGGDFQAPLGECNSDSKIDSGPRVIF